MRSNDERAAAIGRKILSMAQDAQHLVAGEERRKRLEDLKRRMTANELWSSMEVVDLLSADPLCDSSCSGPCRASLVPCLHVFEALCRAADDAARILALGYAGHATNLRRRSAEAKEIIELLKS